MHVSAVISFVVSLVSAVLSSEVNAYIISCPSSSLQDPSNSGLRQLCSILEQAVDDLPQQTSCELVSGNGPSFHSELFIKLCETNGIEPLKSPPCHPQSNGLAERGVQTVKRGLEKARFRDTRGFKYHVQWQESRS